MAILGFIFVVIIALYLTGISLMFFAGGIAFRSKEGFIGLIPLGFAGTVWYYAFTHAPFVISLVTQ